MREVYVCVCVKRTGCFSQGTVCKQREKGCVFKQLFSKMELSVSQPIRASLWRLPLFCGLEATPHCTLKIQPLHIMHLCFFSFSFMIHFYCSFHVTAALFRRTLNHQTTDEISLQGTPRCFFLLMLV